MRKIIAALQVSVDGFIEGPNGELDWVETWEDPFDLLPQIDTCILGGRMYPGYEEYWRAILANPEGILPFTGKVASKGEIAYARFADKTPHIVLSKKLDKVAWKSTQIVRDVEEIRNMKQQPGKDMHAVGGATLVSSLMNLGLIDELRLVVHPIVLGGGKALFRDVKERHGLNLLGAKPLQSGKVRLTYTTQSLP
jgi:dihydrofolate reductase